MMDNQIPAIFVADSPGLDFLNSVTTSLDETIDWISDGEGLLSWLEQAGMVPRKVLDAIRLQVMPAELEDVAAQSRDLRDWFREYVRKRMGRPLTIVNPREIVPLNRLLWRDEWGFEILARDSDATSSFELRANRRWRSAESLLMPVAEAIARVICDEDFTQVKTCARPGCELMFADHTRGHTRRWCRMATCGNRAKVAAHRKRFKVQAAS